MAQFPDDYAATHSTVRQRKLVYKRQPSIEPLDLTGPNDFFKAHQEENQGKADPMHYLPLAPQAEYDRHNNPGG